MNGDYSWFLILGFFILFGLFLFIMGVIDG